MRSVEVLLFGIALICFSGFFLVGQALGVVSESVVTWGLIFGLLLCFLGLLADGENGRDGGGRFETTDSEDGGDGHGGDGDGENSDSDSADTDATESEATESEATEKNPDRERYSASRFPPM